MFDDLDGDAGARTTFRRRTVISQQPWVVRGTKVKFILTRDFTSNRSPRRRSYRTHAPSRPAGSGRMARPVSLRGSGCLAAEPPVTKLPTEPVTNLSFEFRRWLLARRAPGVFS